MAVLSPMRRAIQVTGHRRAVPLLPGQAHASPFRLSHPPLAPSAGLEPATTRLDGGCSVRITARSGTPPHTAPRGGLVLRPPRRRQKNAAGSLCSVRRWIRLESACAVAGFDDADDYVVLDVLDALFASRCSSPTGHPGEPGFRCWRRSASSPRNNSSPVGRKISSALRMPGTSPGAKPTSWPYGQPPPTRGPRLVHPATRGGGSGLALGRDPTARPGRETPRKRCTARQLASAGRCDTETKGRNERSRSDPTGTDPSSRSRALASRTRPNRVLTTRTSRGRTSAEAIATQDNGLTFPIASR